MGVLVGAITGIGFAIVLTGSVPVGLTIIAAATLIAVVEISRD